MSKEKPKEIKLIEKERLQLESNLYLFGEGDGMCQDGAVELFQVGFCNEENKIRFHKDDIPKIIKALQSKFPLMVEENCREFNKNLESLRRKPDD